MTGRSVKIALVFFLFASGLVAQQNSNKVKTAQSLFQMLDTYHYSPAVRNGKLSNHIFDSLIKAIDPYGLFFTGETIASLKPYRDSLFTGSPELTSGFISSLALKYRDQLEFTDSIVDQYFLKPMNFSATDSLILEPDDAEKRPKNNTELSLRWKKWLKQSILKGLFYSEADSVLTKYAVIPDSLYAPGSLLAKKCRIREKRWIARLMNYSGGIENFLMTTYLNCIASCYDPHSNYFSGNDKEKFESSLSKDNYAFGFELGTNLNEEVIISRILPGSPLWYSKKLEKGDVILKIKIPEQDETDLTFASIAEIDNIFNVLNGDFIEMTVRKPDGSISSVELTKGKFDTHENQTLGYILKGDRSVGYIWFSAFYTEFDRYGNVGCSIDFLREMVKLKESGIDGLIIDLRNNPGGAENEAMEIAAYFVGNGPYAIRKNSGGVQNILEKRNAIKWYDGPVVVLVNGSSASGSELLSAILQDYNRAVIVGTNTFGKATEQVVFPVGQKMRPTYGASITPSPETNDFVKVTEGKLFRITGRSYQKIGVEPDIVLPDIAGGFISRESALPFALENDSIRPTMKFLPLPKLPADTLAQLSKNRILKSEEFGKVVKFNNSLVALKNNKVPLNLNQYKLDAGKRKQLTTELENINSSDNKLFRVENTSFKLKEMQSDSLLMEVNEKFRDSIQKDIYVGEAFSVVFDMLPVKSAGSSLK
jgi:carboxyl-terminal processing protease